MGIDVVVQWRYSAVPTRAIGEYALSLPVVQGQGWRRDEEWAGMLGSGVARIEGKIRWRRC